jgi:GDP-4-dehydro-6-deoxy-D-mannose reductase
MSMRVIITGIEGFVGPHLKNELEQNKIEVFGTYLLDPVHSSPNFFHMDVLNPSEIHTVLFDIQPDAIIHLAGFSSVRKSFEQPALCKKVNVDGTENLLKTVARLGLTPKILMINSGEIYGIPQSLPITESHSLSPRSPYGESRILQEKVCQNYIEELGFHIVIARSFNHTGPGQTESFAIPGFAKQIVAIERGEQRPLFVGNLQAIRDYSDVRDVVRAYYALLLQGKNEERYNVCSGNGYRMQDLLNILKSLANVDIHVQVDPSRLRPTDIPELIGDYTKIRIATGWTPQIPIETTLFDVLEFWRNS